ncbi:MAG: hypothetical protein AUH86_02050 [Acidobacteria bacterium 13_1_40CM_4_58_4]|nr:MAG: hypothetical protein AUH86_02050 [Acidobacteria bacterium 13_1_40CM_4_58_4]
MRGTLLHRLPKVRSPKPLVVRAGLGRTFGSLIGFLVLLFLSWGIYLLADAFAHPVDAQAAALIVAAFAISLAVLLLFYLFKPRRVARMDQRQPPEDSATPTAEPLSRAPSVTACREDLRKDQAYQRVYVDHSRIRP